MPKPKRDHIEKPEDKEWRKWFDHLTPKEHDQYLNKLGLSDEDKEGLEEIRELEKSPMEWSETQETKPRKKK